MKDSLILLAPLTVSSPFISPSNCVINSFIEEFWLYAVKNKQARSPRPQTKTCCKTRAWITNSNSIYHLGKHSSLRSYFCTWNNMICKWLNFKNNSIEETGKITHKIPRKIQCTKTGRELLSLHYFLKKIRLQLFSSHPFPVYKVTLYLSTAATLELIDE